MFGDSVEMVRAFGAKFQQRENAHLAGDAAQFADGFNMEGCRELVVYEFLRKALPIGVTYISVHYLLKG